MELPRVLLAAANTEYRDDILAALRGARVRPVVATSVRHARAAVHEDRDLAGAVIWADGDGLALLDDIAAAGPESLAVIAVTDPDERAVEAARRYVGRLGHVAWPILADELEPRLLARLERRALAVELMSLRARVAANELALASSQHVAKRTARELESTTSSLKTATDRLVVAEQLAAVGRVVTGIAHELASQLAMVGYAEAIKVRVQDDPELREFADVIVRAQRRLSDMVEEIRDFATAQAEGRPELVREPAEVGTLIDEAVALLSYDPDVRARSIARNYRSRALVRIDRKRFVQVIINLLSNAVLATERGATIDVSLDEVDGCARVVVADPGEGMSPEVVARLGEIFFTTRGDRGSGLGVGICKRIVEEHGGQLFFESELGRGTRATIELPLLTTVEAIP